MPKDNDNKKDSTQKPLDPKLFRDAMAKGITREMLTDLTQKELAMTTSTNRFFKNAVEVPKILNLVTQYKMDDKEVEFINQKRAQEEKEEKEGKEIKGEDIHYRVFYDDKETGQKIEITNPILIAIDVELQRNPRIAFEAARFMDPSKRVFHCSTLEYAIRTHNFPVINLIQQHVKTINEEKRVDDMIADIRSRAEAPLEPKLLTTAPEQNISDRILIWPADEELPSIIPKNTLLMQLKENKLITYIMIDEKEVDEETKEEKTVKKVKEDKSIVITAALAKEEKPYQAEIIQLLQGKPNEMREFITLGDDPHLVNKLRNLCGYTELPFTEKTPTLVKQGDQLAFWGRLNGKWRLHEFSKEEQALFKQLSEPPRYTDEIQKVMKQYHTEYIDLESYRRNASAFLKKYPVGQDIQNWDEFDADWAELVGGTEILFPGWVGQLWCSSTPFNPVPDFKKLLLNADGANRRDYWESDFFDSRVGVSEGIVKGAEGGADARTRRRARLLCRAGRPWARADIAAMGRLCEVMNRELNLSQKPQQANVIQTPKPSL